MARLLVLSVEAARLWAIEADASATEVLVRHALRIDRPNEVDPEDVRAMGRWVRSSLREAGAGARRTLLVLPRGSVVLKRLSFPGGSAGEDELPGMVRLQMARQLTMPIESAVVDYVPVESGKEEGAPTEVLAAAAPKESVDRAIAIAKAAGLRVAGVGLRGSGLAALLADYAADAGGPVLGVGLGGRSLEIGVVEAGRLAFSRGVELRGSSGGMDDAFAHSIAVEVKRTWMSARGGSLATEISAVGVLGSGDTARRIADACAELLEIPARAVPLPPSVRLPDALGDRERLMAAPLVGLLVARAKKREVIDFAQPRQEPDRSEGPRRALLLTVLGLILSAGGGWTWANMKLDDLKGRVDRARQAEEQQREAYGLHLRQEATLEHLHKRQSLGIDWIAHLDYLTSALPARDKALVGAIDGSLSEGVQFDRNGKSIVGGKWTALQRARFRLQAAVSSREVANELRGVLVSGDIYELENRGADSGPKVDVDLFTEMREPRVSIPEDVKTDKADTEAAGGGES